MTPLNVRIPDELRDRIDAQRGDVPRERWIRRTLESALSAAETREAPVTPANATPIPRGSASPSLERFAKPQRKGKS